MSSTALQAFRSFLTERFTNLAVEIFGEVETIVEACNEENKRLRNLLHVVLNPEIKLRRIDDGQYTDVREQPPEPNTWVNEETPEPVTKTPKEEQIECDISSEQQHRSWGADNLIPPDCIKNDAEEEIHMPCIANSFQIEVEDCISNSSTTNSAEEVDYEDDDGSTLDSDAATQSLMLCCSEGSSSESQEPQKKKKMSKPCLQKTKLELPRMKLNTFDIALPDCHSFLARLTEAYKDFPDDEKPLIATMGLTADVEMVDCALGKVPKGCPLSYQYPVPSSKDYTIHDDAPPRPHLPLSDQMLQPTLTLPPLSTKEQEHMNVLQITWDAAHRLERSTRSRKEIKGLQELRLIGRFREICKLKPGQSHAKKFIFKMKKGAPKCKTAQIDEEMKAEALREYCANMCVNWSPCGLVVHPNAPWLGAMPDGLVYDPKEQHCFGLVHIKCIRFQSFTECSFLVCQQGALQVQTNHPCYWHIQGEMMVTGTSWCDLFVFSRTDLLVQRVYRDSAIINVMKKKLHDFFFCHYLPGLVSD